MWDGSATPLIDGLGSARTETGAGGSAMASQTTTAFGQPVAGSAGAYGFGATSGSRGDVDGDGLLKVGARYYDPQTGSFLTRDTDLGQSPYAYCDGDPVNYVDPSGHIPAILTLAGIARLLAAASVFADNELNPPRLVGLTTHPNLIRNRIS